jgi:hypothetical protein
MILTLDGIKEVVTKNPNRPLIDSGVKKNKSLRMHMYGEGMPEHLKIIKGFEKQWMRDLRVEYTRSNQDLFSRLRRPEDKVYCAKGGSIYYNLPVSQERQAVTMSTDIVNGYSIADWIETFWRLHHADDPCGVMMMELLPKEEAIKARREGRSFVYPTYKSITSIYDYLPKGVRLEYIAFELDKAERRAYGYTDERVFRIVDDAFDYIVYWVGKDDVFIDWQNTIVNFFGSVPAIINSDNVDPKLENSFVSYVDDIMKLADEFLLKGSIKVTSDFRHGFPKYAEFGDNCPVCSGEGVHQGDKCNECNGCGKVIRLRVTDDKILNWPGDKELPLILPKDTGGYIEPPKTYYEIAISDMASLENFMSLTLWGVPSRIRTQGLSVNVEGPAKTATEELLQAKPQADRLHPISKAAEKRYKFMLDIMIRMQIAANYPGSSVTYGRRYMLEGPDALWLKYSEARAKGVSISALDDLLLEYYEAKYATDRVKLAVQTKLMRVEPFIHYKESEVGGFRLSDEDYKAKIFYGEWLARQASGTLYALSADELRDSLYKFVATKQLQAIEPKATIAA